MKQQRHSAGNALRFRKEREQKALNQARILCWKAYRNRNDPGAKKQIHHMALRLSMRLRTGNRGRTKPFAEWKPCVGIWSRKVPRWRMNSSRRWTCCSRRTSLPMSETTSARTRIPLPQRNLRTLKSLNPMTDRFSQRYLPMADISGVSTP